MKYYVDYTDKSGDLCHVWVDAESATQAEGEVLCEYHDVREIISIRKA